LKSQLKVPDAVKKLRNSNSQENEAHKNIEISISASFPTALTHKQGRMTIVDRDQECKWSKRR